MGGIGPAGPTTTPFLETESAGLGDQPRRRLRVDRRNEASPFHWKFHGIGLPVANGLEWSGGRNK